MHSTREHTHGDSSAAGIAPAYIGQKEVDPLPQTKGPSHQWPSKPLSSETKVPSRDLDGSDPMFVQGDETSHNTSDESVDTVNSDWDMTQIESRMQELKRETETMIKAVEDSIEKTIDAILDKKLKTVSIVVANAVTKRLMKAMDKKLSQTKLQDQTYGESINIPVTQQSPALTKEIETVVNEEPDTESMKSLDSYNNTRQMLDALPTLDTQNSAVQNPIHDNIPGSRTTGT